MARFSGLKIGAMLGALAIAFLASSWSEATAQVRWQARAQCSATGAWGTAWGQRSRANAAAIAVRNCIRAGGIPRCCQVTSLNPYRAF